MHSPSSKKFELKKKKIEEVKIRRKNATNEEISFKGAAYADDISVISTNLL
jgi:hypothetical protein